MITVGLQVPLPLLLHMAVGAGTDYYINCHQLSNDGLQSHINDNDVAVVSAVGYGNFASSTIFDCVFF